MTKLNQLHQPIKKKEIELSPGGLIVLLSFSVCFIILLLITILVLVYHNTSFDEFIFSKLQPITSLSLTKLLLFITFFGTFNFLLPAYLVLIIYYLFKRKKFLYLPILFIGLSSTAALYSLKYLFKRPRPLDPLLHSVNGFSFPSGHSFSGFTFFGVLIYIVWQSKIKKIWKWILYVLLFIFAFSIGLSRIYLHVHFASDVLAGFCLSVIWLTISFWILQAVKKNRNV